VSAELVPSEAGKQNLPQSSPNLWDLLETPRSHITVASVIKPDYAIRENNII
jgi:hypothetical protein